MLDIGERCFPIRMTMLEREVMSIRTYKLKLIVLRIIKIVLIVKKDNRP